ncbi:Ada metal-binding domain-containing protein [Nitratidesulfovibrio termitidis]|uniref:Ada metal-binding domain-containing protein n=1 Tax=Nitratidesulfovibrio termitidis TaxID=42252 RepID=UPI000410569E|nr:Ada metal-binding domain-containing protein [Nitratidesulfovibrio termitidis]
MRATPSLFRYGPYPLAVRAAAAVLLTLLLALPPTLVLTVAVLSAQSIPAAQAAQNAAYHGNVQSHIFHRLGCTYYACKACTAVFATRKAALDAGFRPCKVCKP